MVRVKETTRQKEGTCPRRGRGEEKKPGALFPHPREEIARKIRRPHPAGQFTCNWKTEKGKRKEGGAHIYMSLPVKKKEAPDAVVYW